GRRILVPRLRARSVDGHELELPSFVYAAGRDPLDARTLEAIAIGITTRKYHRALDPLPTGTRKRAVSKSSVSRHFVALTSAQLTTWLARPLVDLEVRSVFLDGLHFRDHVILLALGVDSQGQKHVLAHLPEAMRPRVCRALAEAYELADVTLANRRLLQLAAGLDHMHPGAAASLREGLDETLTRQRLGVTGALYRTLRSTTPHAPPCASCARPGAQWWGHRWPRRRNDVRPCSSPHLDRPDLLDTARAALAGLYGTCQSR